MEMDEFHLRKFGLDLQKKKKKLFTTNFNCTKSRE